MNKEVVEHHTCSLELEGGYHGRPYPQEFVRAPLSQHPSPAPLSGKETPKSMAMDITMGK